MELLPLRFILGRDQAHFLKFQLLILLQIRPECILLQLMITFLDLIKSSSLIGTELRLLKIVQVFLWEILLNGFITFYSQPIPLPILTDFTFQIWAILLLLGEQIMLTSIQETQIRVRDWVCFRMNCSFSNGILFGRLQGGQERLLPLLLLQLKILTFDYSDTGVWLQDRFFQQEMIFTFSHFCRELRRFVR